MVTVMKKSLCVLMVWVSCLLSVVAGEKKVIVAEVEELGDYLSVNFEEPIGDVYEELKVNEPAEDGCSAVLTSDREGPFPRLWWGNEHSLMVEFAPGTQPGTHWRLELPQMVVEFSSPPCRLTQTEAPGLSCGLPKGGAKLSVQQPYYDKIDCLTAPETKYRFEVKDEAGRTLREVPGVARCVRGGDLTEAEWLHLLSRIASVEGLSALNPDSPVPGMVIVEPTEDLSGSRCRLQVENAQGLVVKEGNPEFVFPRSLQCLPEVRPVLHEGRQRLLLQLLFNAPLTAETAAEIFRHLHVESNGVAATASADGLSRELQVGNQKLRLTFEPAPERVKLPWKDRHSGYVGAFVHRTMSVDIWVDGAQQLPLPLQLTVKGGITAAGGLLMAQDCVLPVVLNPLSPSLPEVGDSPIRVPLHGPHRLKFSCAGADTVVVRAARLDARQYVLVKDDLNRGHDIPGEVQSLLGEEKEFAVPEGEDPLSIAEQDLPLDEVPGFGSKPGMYLLTLKAKAGAAQQQALRALGADPASADAEICCVVMLTDLRAVRLGEARVLVTRLSDGSPVESGSISHYRHRPDDSIECLQSYELSNGLAEQPGNCRFSDTLLIHSGDDYIPVFSSVYSGTDDSSHGFVHVFTDRELYRPGDVVHLRGALRRSGEGGDLELPHGQEVQLCVKYNEKVFAEHTVPLNEYGAFGLEWKLPEEAAAAVGEWLVEVRSEQDDAEYTHQLYCEVFRRNSFYLNTELTAEPVRPELATLKVQALQYDGMPLVHGRLKVEVSQGTEESTSELLTDAAGCATLEIPVIPEPEWEEGQWTSLRVRGSVCNERQEYVAFDEHLELHPADFGISVSCSGSREPVIRLFKTDEKGDIPPEQPQELELKLYAPVYESRQLPGGLLLYESRMSCIHRQQVMVPAHCREGVQTNFKPIIREFMNRMQREGAPCSPPSSFTLNIQGRDSAGRIVRGSGIVHSGNRTYLNERPLDCPEVPAEIQDGCLVVPVDFSCDGTAVLVMQDSRSCRVCTVPVQAGARQLKLPVPQGIGGQVLGRLVLPVRKDGCYSETEALHFRTTLPYTGAALHVEWALPQQVHAPGSRVELAGRVLLPGGAPAAHAELCLYVVDAGMLSLSSYTLLDPVAAFSTGICGWAALTEMSFAGPAEEDLLLSTLPFMQRSAAEAMNYYTLPGFPGWNGVRAHRYFNRADSVFRARALAEVDALWEDAGDGRGNVRDYRLRRDFTPTPLWLPELRTDAEGRFRAGLTLPDSMTTYRVIAVVLGRDGKSAGSGEAALTVVQPLMLTPGTPHFMSVGDSLRLPVTTTNNSGSGGSWSVTLQGCEKAQQVALADGQSATLYFDYTALAEGECTLQWQAVGSNGGDAVQGAFPLRFPAPLLQEIHRLRLRAGDAPLRVVELLAPELRRGRHLQVEVVVSADPLLQLQHCLNFALNYPYGCTEQLSSNLLPWLLHERLAAYDVSMRQKTAAEVREVVQNTLAVLLSRQQPDGGLRYWDGGESCYWASAHAALVMTFAGELGYELPPGAMERLRAYLLREPDNQKEKSVFTRYAVGRACHDNVIQDAALAEIAAGAAPEHGGFRSRYAGSCLKLISELRSGKRDHYPAFMRWLQHVAAGTERLSTWDSGWVFIALHEYRLTVAERETSATLATADGHELTLGCTPVTLSAEQAATLTAVDGTAFISLRAKALPQQTDFPGVADKGLQLTRRYEKCGTDGVWHEADAFRVGDVVRVTLTCRGSNSRAQYVALEDYLPACMEAINPNVPSQAAGLSFLPWREYFDHREYLPHSVRSFRTRRFGHEPLQMTYYARVKFAGRATAPPAQGLLMYEPQVYGLSASAVIHAEQ